MASLQDLPASPSAGILHVVVESPRGFTSKIKYDPKLQVFVLSRPLPLGLSYPHDWGFVPGTKGDDGDPVDAMVLGQGTSFPGLVLATRPVAILAIEQDGKPAARGGEAPRRQRNDRIIAISAADPRAPWRSLAELPERVREEIEQFFIQSTVFEHKNVAVLGWEGPERALAYVASRC